MKAIHNLSFKMKLILLITPPIIGAILFSALELNQVLHNRKMIEQIQPLIQLSITGGAIVHELQKERGTTSGFVGSGGKDFQATLKNQRESTDSVLKREMQNIKILSENIRQSQPTVYNDLQTILQQLDQLSGLRNEVDKLSISVTNAAKFYTDLNTLWLSLSASISNLSTFSDLTTELRNYSTFMQSKEYAGQERATLNVALVNGAFPEGNYYKFVTLESIQQAYLQSFEQFATPEQLKVLASIESSPATKKVETIRAVANSKYISGNFGVTGAEWFDASTERINQFKILEDQIAEDIRDSVQQLAKASNKTLLMTAGATLLLLVITLSLALLISNILINQALSLAHVINEVTNSRDLTLRVNIQSTDELGSSAARFNDMLEVLGDMLKNIESSSIQLATAAEQTSMSVKESTHNLGRQSQETELAASATEEMTATVNEIASSTTLTADSASRAATLSAQGVAEVQSNARNMNLLNEQMSSANSLVIQLHDSSKEINEIVEVIKAVAEQTNLLALNAAIEAARAGEHGRGFAVVADEVRTLAQRTQDSTQKIEEMVVRFQSDADSVSKAIESSFAHVQESLEQTISVQDKLGEINTAVESITDMCHQIATAAEEQVAATNEIAQNIRTINDLSGVSSEMGNQISSAAQEQTTLANRQLELVRRFILS